MMGMLLVMAVSVVAVFLWLRWRSRRIDQQPQQQAQGAPPARDDFWVALGEWLAAANNNRLIALWVFAWASFILNLTVFGLGGFEPMDTEGLMEQAERVYYGEATRVVPPTDTGARVWGWLRQVSWLVGTVTFIAALLYTPVAFSDEVARGLARLAEYFRQRRQAAEPRPGRPAAPPEGVAAQPRGEPGERPLTFWGYLLAEVVTDFLQEFFQLLAHRRLRQ